MTDSDKPSDEDAGDRDDLSEALDDPETLAFLKNYLAISDDELRAHVRRLVEEIRVKKKL